MLKKLLVNVKLTSSELRGVMELTNEQIVTNLLSEKEIINPKKNNGFASNPTYNLGEFLSDFKPEPSPYEGKYVFIR